MPGKLKLPSYFRRGRRRPTFSRRVDGTKIDSHLRSEVEAGCFPSSTLVNTKFEDMAGSLDPSMPEKSEIISGSLGDSMSERQEESITQNCPSKEPSLTDYQRFEKPGVEGIVPGIRNTDGRECSGHRVLEDEVDEDEIVVWQPQEGSGAKLASNADATGSCAHESSMGRSLSRDGAEEESHWGLGFQHGPNVVNSAEKLVIIPETEEFAEVFVDRGSKSSEFELKSEPLFLQSSDVDVLSEKLKSVAVVGHEQPDHSSQLRQSEVLQTRRKQGGRVGRESLESGYLSIGGVKVFTDTGGHVLQLSGKKQRRKRKGGRAEEAGKAQNESQCIIDSDMDALDSDTFEEYLASMAEECDDELDTSWMVEKRIGEQVGIEYMGAVDSEEDSQDESAEEEEGDKADSLPDSDSESDSDTGSEDEEEIELLLAQAEEAEGSSPPSVRPSRKSVKKAAPRRGKEPVQELPWEVEMEAVFLKDVRSRQHGRKVQGAARAGAGEQPHWPVGSGGRSKQQKGKKGKGKRSVPGEKKRVREEKIAVKRANRLAQHGLDLHSVHLALCRLVEGGEEQHTFPPMTNAMRAQVHKMARLFRLHSCSHGAGKKRFTVVTTSEHAGLPDEQGKKTLAKMLARPSLTPGAVTKASVLWKGVSADPKAHAGGHGRPFKGRGPSTRTLRNDQHRLPTRGSALRARPAQSAPQAAPSFVPSGLLAHQAGPEAAGQGRPAAVAGAEAEGAGGFASFEAHTTGFGSRLMAKMGYMAGDGLGKQGQGIAAPIQVEKRPKSLGLGARV